MLMNTNDLFYLAYEHYKKELENNRDIYLFRKGVNSRKSPEDYLSMVTIECDIDEEWIAAIEKGLHYIAKAIKEDRQFIRNEGEVLPIEKIRRVSKDSIIDLSKHSNYITRMPENPDDNVVPEKLMMIKRENDYSIYENRVVYTTLSYLKDFVATRLDKIKEVTNRYNGTVQIKKKIELGYRNVDVNLLINDVQNNDTIALDNNSAASKIKRIDLILNSVLVLLRTPLMQEVSKAPLVNRPVTKTNVLKMNTNFKESLAVFDYVCAYSGPGFVIKEVEKKIFPLSEEQENCFTDIVLLTSFFSYQFNNKIGPQLHKEYLLEEKTRQEVIDNETLEKIKSLIDKASKSGKDLGEYLLALENGYKILEQRVEDAKEEAKKLVEEYELKIANLNTEHQQEIDKLNEYHDELVAKLQDEQLIEIANLEERKREEIAKYQAECEKRIEEEKERLNNQYSSLIESQKREIEEKQSLIDKLTSDNSGQSKMISDLEEKHASEIKDLKEELDYYKVTSLTNKFENDRNFNLKDLSSKEAFDELERQKALIDDLFEKAWKETKKEIKKQHFAIEKKKKGDK